MANIAKGSKKYYGKYGGIVTDNHDKKGLGRIRARVRRVLEGEQLGWALPCVPYAGRNVGIFFVPPVGSNVWIEFEDGDPEKPIWCGCCWIPSDLIGLNTDPEIKFIKTEHAMLKINDKEEKNSINIKTQKNQEIIMKPDSIELIQDGCSVKLTDRAVYVNGNNLQILK